MSTATLTNAERIQERVARGEYADADEVVARALDALEYQENLVLVRALIDEARASVAKHGAIPMTATFWDDLMEEARKLDPNTPLPRHLQP